MFQISQLLYPKAFVMPCNSTNVYKKKCSSGPLRTLSSHPKQKSRGIRHVLLKSKNLERTFRVAGLWISLLPEVSHSRHVKSHACLFLIKKCNSDFHITWYSSSPYPPIERLASFLWTIMPWLSTNFYTLMLLMLRTPTVHRLIFVLVTWSLGAFNCTTSLTALEQHVALRKSECCN